MLLASDRGHGPAVERAYDLERGGSYRAGRGGDEDARTEPDPCELRQRDPGGEERHREGCALREARTLGERKEPAPLDGHSLRVATSVSSDEAHHPLTVDLACDLGAENRRELRHLRVPPEPDQDVGEVDPARADIDDRLALAGLWLGHLLDDELLRPSDRLQDDCLHRWGSDPGTCPG